MRVGFKRLQFSERAHDLLGDLDLGSAIVFSWPLWRIEIVDIDRAMFKVEMDGIRRAFPRVNDMERQMSRAAFFEPGALECDAVRTEVAKWRRALQQIILARNDQQLFRPQVRLWWKSEAGELN